MAQKQGQIKAPKKPVKPATFDEALEVLNNVALHDEGEIKHVVDDKKHKIQEVVAAPTRIKSLVARKTAIATDAAVELGESTKEMVAENPWPFVIGAVGVSALAGFLLYRRGVRYGH